MKSGEDQVTRSTFLLLVLFFTVRVPSSFAVICLDDKDGGQTLSRLPPTGVRILKELLAQSGTSSAIVTRIDDTPEGQIDAMYHNAKNNKSAAYSGMGKSLLDLYEANKSKGEREVKALMVDTLKSLSKLSQQRYDRQGFMHVEAPLFIVFDISPRSFTPEQAKAFRDATDHLVERGVVRRFLHPLDGKKSGQYDPAYHLELLNQPETFPSDEMKAHATTESIERMRKNGQVSERYEVVRQGQRTLKHGGHRKFSSEGRLISEGRYECGRRVGTWRTFREEDGSLMSKTRYLFGARMGNYARYDAKGRKTEEGWYLSDRKANGPVGGIMEKSTVSTAMPAGSGMAGLNIGR